MDWAQEGTGEGEYFVLENRQRQNAYYESYLPASGLVIWRVDESQPDNNDHSRRLATIIQADGEVVDADGSNVPGRETDVWPGSLQKRDFTPSTFPSSDLSGNRFSGVAVENITQELDRSVTAEIRVGVPKKGRTYACPNPYSLSTPGGLGVGEDVIQIVFLPDPGPDRPYRFNVRIFDLEGNLVRTLNSGSEIRGDGVAEWDVKNEAGKPVGPGLYFYHVESSGREATGVIGIKK
jgi:hypothetical protein